MAITIERETFVFALSHLNRNPLSRDAWFDKLTEEGPVDTINFLSHWQGDANKTGASDFPTSYRNHVRHIIASVQSGKGMTTMLETYVASMRDHMFPIFMTQNYESHASRFKKDFDDFNADIIARTEKALGCQKFPKFTTYVFDNIFEAEQMKNYVEDARNWVHGDTADSNIPILIVLSNGSKIEKLATSVVPELFSAIGESELSKSLILVKDEADLFNKTHDNKTKLEEAFYKTPISKVKVTVMRNLIQAENTGEHQCSLIEEAMRARNCNAMRPDNNVRGKGKRKRKASKKKEQVGETHAKCLMDVFHCIINVTATPVALFLKEGN
ncbi:unnamed protein product [Chrysoparadoxa australica]